MIKKILGMFLEFRFFYKSEYRWLMLKLGIPFNKKILDSFEEVSPAIYIGLAGTPYNNARHMEYVSKVRECRDLGKFFVFARFGEAHYVFIESFDDFKLSDLTAAEIIKIYKICVFENRYSLTSPEILRERLYRFKAF